MGVELNSSSALGFATAVLVVVAACNYTDGECFPREELYESAAAGGGVIVPTGVGGYGDAPREPQSAPPDPDEAMCNRISGGPCDDKCQAGYDDASIACAKIEDAAQRRTCQDKAHEIYWACKQKCEQEPSKSCDEKWQDCVAHGPSFCQRKSNNKIFCTSCWERCNAGDYPSPECQQCRF